MNQLREMRGSSFLDVIAEEAHIISRFKKERETAKRSKVGTPMWHASLQSRDQGARRRGKGGVSLKNGNVQQELEKFIENFLGRGGYLTGASTEGTECSPPSGGRLPTRPMLKTIFLAFLAKKKGKRAR